MKKAQVTAPPDRTILTTVPKLSNKEMRDLIDHLTTKLQVLTKQLIDSDRSNEA